MKKGILLVCFICILLGIIFYFGEKEVSYQENKKYFSGDVYSVNGAANMYDLLNESGNGVISPIEVNLALSNLYGLTDNNSFKELKNYFGLDLGDNQEKIDDILKQNVLEEKSSDSFDKLYVSFMETFYSKGYDKLKISSIKNLSIAEKEELLILLVRIRSCYQRIYGFNNYNEKFIKGLKPTKEEEAYSAYELFNLLNEVLDNYENYSLKRSLAFINALFYSRDFYSEKSFNEEMVQQLRSNCKFMEYDISGENGGEIFKKNLDEIFLDSVKYYISGEDLRKKESLYLGSLKFANSWEKNINGYYNSNREFTDFSGVKTVSEMMNFMADDYLENDYAVGFLKRYDGGKFSFVGILPKDRNDFKLGELNLVSLLVSKGNNSPVKISIPKFQINYEFDLFDIVGKMGVNEIFSDKANFNRFVNSSFQIEMARQKNAFAFLEKGTFATDLNWQKMEAFSQDSSSKEIIFDRPFAYMVINNETDDVILIGAIKKS